MVLDKELIVNLFLIIFYIIILYIFDKAKRRFSGGMIEKVINLIIISVLLMLVSDYVIIISVLLMLVSDYVSLLEAFIPPDFVFIIRVLFRLAALAVLAFGGLRLLTV
jgi:hypothetical protein